MSHESRTQLGLLNSWMFFSRSNIDCVSNKMDGPRPFLGRFWIQSCLFLRLVTVTVLKISFRPIILDVYLNSELLSPTQAKEPNLPVFRPSLPTNSFDQVFRPKAGRKCIHTLPTDIITKWPKQSRWEFELGSSISHSASINLTPHAH